jgi:hypothetical protein
MLSKNGSTPSKNGLWKILFIKLIYLDFLEYSTYLMNFRSKQVRTLWLIYTF